jgi:hypothetical protein
MSKKPTKTANGSPTSQSSLNLELPLSLKKVSSGSLAYVAQFYSRLNDVMSGMYIGVGCAGTAQSHHRYEKSEKPKSTSD